MPAKVHNFGLSRFFPTCVGNIFIAASQTRTIRNDKAAEQLKRYPLLKIQFLAPPLKPAPVPRPRPVIDYGGYHINLLRHKAAQAGVKGTLTMKKVELIKKLQALQER